MLITYFKDRGSSEGLTEKLKCWATATSRVLPSRQLCIRSMGPCMRPSVRKQQLKMTVAPVGPHHHQSVMSQSVSQLIWNPCGAALCLTHHVWWGMSEDQSQDWTRTGPVPLTGKRRNEYITSSDMMASPAAVNQWFELVNKVDQISGPCSHITWAEQPEPLGPEQHVSILLITVNAWSVTMWNHKQIYQLSMYLHLTSIGLAGFTISWF